jgi:predicted membrane chloride channel (bestrophin family)
MVHAQLLQSHLYHGSDVLPIPLHILEKVKLIEKLSIYLNAYREALKLASTPLPFTMIQMGRTFLFLWTFTIPFALVGIIDEIVSELIFVFFLTYGYIGLEFVSMRLLHPWGDGINDINIVGMGQAVVVGMENDFKAMSKRGCGGFQKKNMDGGGVYVVGPDHSQSTMGSDQGSTAHYYAFT